MATYNQSQMTLPSGDVVKFIDNTSGYTKNAGTITGVTANGGLTGGGTSGTVTIGHSNSVTAQTTQAVYPIKIDAQGHISAYGSAVTIPSAVTESTVSGWGFTKNAGTVTSVRVQATSPVASSTSTAQTGSLNTTISLNNGYGDTKNPYAAKSANQVLAGPSSGEDATPEFRTLVAADIPTLTKSKISDFPTSMTPTSHTHGNLSNDGKITSTATIATGDKLVIVDSDTTAASKITGSSITFDTSKTGMALTQAGTWAAFTNNAGTITGVTAGTGLSGGGTSGAITLNHSNSVTAQTTQAVYPIKIDAQGHISAYGSAVTIPSAVTESTVSGWGFTKNAGTITGIKMNGASKGSSGVVDLGTVLTSHQDISGKVDKINITAQGTQAVYPIKINAQGQITAYGSAVSIPAAVAVKGNAETSYRTGNVNLTPANIGAATSDHTHTTSLATSSGTSTITLAHGSKYQLTAGGTSVIFTMPADSNTDTKVTNTLATTTKYYVTGTTSASTNTGTQSFDSGIYSTTTAGQLNATTYLVNEKVRLEYNSTTKSLDFIFI